MQLKKVGKFMTSDVIINKSATIQRCIYRVHQEYDNDPQNLSNYTKQDSIILNIQRACEASIDLAMFLVSDKKLGIPQHSRDAFAILNQHKIINDDLTKSLQSMVGFRNIAVHDYQSLNLNIVENIIKYKLKDLLEFCKVIIKQ